MYHYFREACTEIEQYNENKIIEIIEYLKMQQRVEYTKVYETFKNGGENNFSYILNLF